jgi:septal ring factor EnvC (AmiA/AmiB activator)
MENQIQKSPRHVRGSLFSRLRNKLRQHQSENTQLRERIRQLEASVAAENRKACDLDGRLRRVVDAYATQERGLNDVVRLCVNVDRRVANLSHGNVVFEEATRQLMESLRHVLSCR